MPLSVDHEHVHAFIAFLQLKNLSTRTIGLYQWVLKDFFQRCPPGLTTPGDVAFPHLRDYVAGLQARHLAAKTVGDRVIILKRFFAYLIMEGCITRDPSQRLPIPKVGKRLPKALTLEETQSFFAVLLGDSAVERRDRLLFELLYAGGLRVSEAVNLKVKDVDYADGSVRIVGKGDKERRIYLKPPLMQSLHEYIDERQLDALVFPGRDGRPLTVRNVELRIKRCAEVAGITRPVTPHTLRHSIAVHYLQGGAPVNFVQGLLGHSSLATTGRYLQLTDQMAKQITLQTKTALDGEPVGGKERKGRERKAAYKSEPASENELFLTCVIEWLTTN